MPWWPRAGENGLFCWTVRFATTQNAASLSHEIEQWCEQWISENNDTSNKPIISPENPDETLDPYNYFLAFVKAPYVVKADNNQLWLRFDGIYEGSYWWRDWSIRIVTFLKVVFPELTVIKFDRDCLS